MILFLFDFVEFVRFVFFFWFCYSLKMRLRYSRFGCVCCFRHYTHKASSFQSVYAYVFSVVSFSPLKYLRKKKTLNRKFIGQFIYNKWSRYFFDKFQIAVWMCVQSIWRNKKNPFVCLDLDLDLLHMYRILAVLFFVFGIVINIPTYLICI